MLEVDEAQHAAFVRLLQKE